jgi:hypothetical protein
VRGNAKRGSRPIVRDGVKLTRMNVTQDFEKWAKGYSGCDGGNLHGSVWFCGIEWGTGTDHDLKAELRDSVSEPPQKYRALQDVLRDPISGKSHPYGVRLIKLITAMRLPAGYSEPFPFHRRSQFFKLNLFPVAFKEVDPQLWIDKYQTATGLATRDSYVQWCRENRFPQMRSWVEKGKPKLIVGIGAGKERKPDFKGAFGFTDAQENEETIEGKKLVWMRNGKAILAIIPFLGYQNGLLNSDQLVQTFGERLGAFEGLERSHAVESSSRPRETDFKTSRKTQVQWRIPRRDQPNRTSLSTEDGWNRTYSNPQRGKQTEFIERALSDVPWTAEELTTIANLIAGRPGWIPNARVNEHLTYHHLELGTELRARRGDKKLRMPQLIYWNGRWSMPSHMRPT